MKKRRVTILIIVSYLALWVIFSLFIIVSKSINASLWSDPTWEYLIYGVSLNVVIGWRASSILSIVLVPVGIAGCIGLIISKNWGHRLAILSMGLTLLWPAYILYVTIDSLWIYGIYNVFFDLVTPILLTMILLALSILSLIFLSRSNLREHIENKLNGQP